MIWNSHQVVFGDSIILDQIKGACYMYGEKGNAYKGLIRKPKVKKGWKTWTYLGLFC